VRILVADDDPVSRLFMRKMLQRIGFDVSTAADGFEAVAKLSSIDGPRLALLDWTMPGLSGLEVCRAIREGERRAYVYMTLLTSKDSKEDLVAGLEAGADDYLTKPCHPQELRARLRTGQRILQLEDILVNAHEQMRISATHDAMTQLLNRAAIHEELLVQLNDARLQRAEFSILLCDVDHFKNVNDTYGHPVGDAVLREVASRLKSAVRKGSVGRYGGEEFMLVLDGCPARHLEAVAHRICNTVRATPIETDFGPLNITLSAGAVHIASGSAAPSAEEVISCADRLLYQAKRMGRDRILVVQPHTSSEEFSAFGQTAQILPAH
jgi:two-component system cell cycle response regulator